MKRLHSWLYATALFIITILLDLASSWQATALGIVAALAIMALEFMQGDRDFYRRMYREASDFSAQIKQILDNRTNAR